jgi:potassium-transporting ATPase KdpC subunit
MRDIVLSLRSVVALWLLTALIYPLLILLIGQGLLPGPANGSLLTNAQGQIVGSALIGQTFSRDDYFWSRPSAVTYSEGAEVPTGVSGASNLAPSNPDLLDRVETEADRLQAAGVPLTADLLYSSSSGLDPHLSPAAVQGQVARVAAARGLPPETVQQLVNDHIEGRFLGLFGEPTVNLLQLNLALDQLA